RMAEGSSIAEAVVAVARASAAGVERVMIILDSNHTHEHVLGEVRAHAPLVSVGQFLVVADTFIEDIPHQSHRPGRPWGPGDNPGTALRDWLREEHPFAAGGLFNRKGL